MDWQLATLVGDYLRVGKRSDQWDAAATNLLYILACERTRRSNAPPLSVTTYQQEIDAVRAAGCEDPMVNYVVYTERLAPLARRGELCLLRRT